MTGSAFKPWVGSEYAKNNRFGMKLLVIGESFYLTDDDRDKLDFAQGLMKNVIDSKCASWDAKSNRRKAWRTRFFKRLFYPLTDGKKFGEAGDEWGDVWNSIAYTVYVQTTRLSKPRERAPAEDWAKGPDNVLDAVQQLKPDRVLLVGKGIWGHFCGHLEEFRKREIPFPEINYIYHPASRQWFKEQENARQTVLSLLGTSRVMKST